MTATHNQFGLEQQFDLPQRTIPQNCLIVIPARMNSTRLPGKPLADINGLPMIVRVATQAKEAKLGKVLIATDHLEIKKTVEEHGFEAVMTREDHQSGSDRIFEAIEKKDPNGNFELIVNVQGDLPTIDPFDIVLAASPLKDEKVDIATLCAPISREEEKTNPDVVKLIGSKRPTLQDGHQRFKALYFTRATAPTGDGPLYHHIGLYVYRRKSLEKFVKLSPSSLEQREKLEQLRALEADMRIDATVVNNVPLGVDSAADLERARQYTIRNEALKNID